ncbi:uncharacterized protein O9250_011952 [Rhynochetos jubatus]
MAPQLTRLLWVLAGGDVAFSSLGTGPGRAFGEMFLPLGCRRGFPREPNPCWAGPRPPRPHSPQGNWEEPPWEHQRRRGRVQWFQGLPREQEKQKELRAMAGRRNHSKTETAQCALILTGSDLPLQPRPWSSRRNPGPANFPRNEEDGGWAPSDGPPPPHWGDGEDIQGPENCFEESWDPPGSWSPKHVPGHADFPRDGEDGRWAPSDRPPPPHWGDGEDSQGPEDRFEGSWNPELPELRDFAWNELHNEEQHPPWPPTRLPGKRGKFQDDSPSWVCHGVGYPPSFRSYYSDSRTSWPRAKEQSQHPDPPQPLRKDGAQSREPTAQGPPAANEKVPERPPPASSPQKSPAADLQAATEAAEPEQAAGAMPVEPGAKQTPEDSQSPSASETELAPPEESSAGTGEHLEVEPCSRSVPEDGGSHPHGETAPPEPAKDVCAAAGSAGGAELCPSSQEQQHLPSGAGEPNAEAPCDEPLSLQQPSKNSQVPPGATAEPPAEPSQACSNICTTPQASPGTQHPPGSGETQPAAGSRCRLCSTLLAPSLASMDQRSAAVLARKEEIELSYQQFSLTIAVVATMLLQKEPSMEAALGVALRANLRQGRIHHLQKLEDFINSYDSATLKH